jgi:hypothetical protein
LEALVETHQVFDDLEHHLDDILENSLIEQFSLKEVDYYQYFQTISFVHCYLLVVYPSEQDFVVAF